MPRSNNKQSRARVLVIDDHPAMREALAFRISKLPDLEICGEAADMPEALQLVRETQPDIAVVDISLKKSSGLDLIKRIKAMNDKVRILVWSMHGEGLYAERALRAGALGYITKEQATGKIVEAIRQVAAGKIYLSPEMAEKLLHRTIGATRGPINGSPAEALADRELEVFRLIGQGVKTSEIAARLYVTIGTIWTYRDRIRKKLGLGNGTELVHYATQWVLDNG